MIISFLNQKGGVGKTTLALHVAVALQMQERGRGLVIDADPQGSALDWQAQRAAASPVPVVGMPTPTLHRDAPAIAADTDYLVIDGAAAHGRDREIRYCGERSRVHSRPAVAARRLGGT